MGQFRVTPGQKAKIRAMLKFYQRDRGQMAVEVMDALFYHCDQKDQLAFPLRFVVVGVWGATEQLWNAFHNCSVAPQTPFSVNVEGCG